MIGKPEWFSYRVFGWGLGLKTWQSFVYLAVAAVLLVGSIALAGTGIVGIWLPIALFALLIIDVIHIMTQMTKVKDERENYHQLIIERNCSFAAIAALIGVAIYQSYQKGALFTAGAQGTNGLPFDTSILIVLAAMLLTKIASTLYVRMKR